MLRWLRSRAAPAAPPPADTHRTLTHEEVLAWRSFVSEVNALLAEGPNVPGLHAYAERIRHAVIHRRLTVDEFLAAHPAPWKR